MTLLLSCGKARATHGDNNDVRQLLLHSGKVKSINYSGIIEKGNN